MPAIKWILYREKVVARDSPAFIDVDNRPLRQLVELHGWEPDDPNFEGLHHFPAGLYSDDISEETVGNGIHLRHDTTIEGDLTLAGGQFSFTANNDWNVALAGFDFNIDDGDLHLSNGRFFGEIDIGVIATSLTIGNDTGIAPVLNATLRVAENGTFRSDSLDDVELRFLNLLTEAVNYAPGRVWTEHKIGGYRWVSFDPSVTAETLTWWTNSMKHVWTKGVGVQLEIDGYGAGDGEIRSFVSTEFHDVVKLFYDLFGGRTLEYGAAGSGGTGKRLVVVDD